MAHGLGAGIIGGAGVRACESSLYDHEMLSTSNSPSTTSPRALNKIMILPGPGPAGARGRGGGEFFGETLSDPAASESESGWLAV